MVSNWLLMKYLKQMGKNKKLPEYIKDVIQQYGKDIVKDSRLSNILNDVASFDDVPAAKNVLRTILKKGYGARLLEEGKNTTEWKLRTNTYSREISATFGYQQEIVNYLFESITYGLGWTNSIPFYETPGNGFSDSKNETNKSAISDLNGELAIQRKEYLQLLEKLLVVPSKTSAYYPASALTQLKLVEGKIRLLCDALCIKDNGWCQKEKEKVLKAYYKDTSSLKKKAYLKFAAVAAVAIIGGTIGATYVSSMDEMDSYNQTIQQGDAFMSSGLYDQALSNYQDAYTNYNAFNSSGYKHDAFQKMNMAVDRLIEGGKNDNTTLLSAYNAIQSELRLELTSSEKAEVLEKLAYVETEIASRVENGKNTLVLNISANQGELNDEGKVLLDELLNFSPKDYWLNFIQNKEQ